MRVRGRQILEDAFALLGTFAPGGQIENRLIDQAIRFANSKIEELNQRSSTLPGVAIQDLETRADETEYWIGPTADMQSPPGLKTSGAPDFIEAAVRVSAVGGVPISGLPVPVIARSAAEWVVASNRQPPTSSLTLYLRSGPGGSDLDQAPNDGRSYADGNRKLEIYPGYTGFVRLYMRVPEIQTLGDSRTAMDAMGLFDLPPGVHRTLTTNIAASLTTVFGCDPQTAEDIKAQAAAAAGEQQRKNLRGRRPAAHLPLKWLGTVSGDGGEFEVRGVIDR